jgi:quinol-cytochrome oxidoreductase complex cytochrome b subunit
MQGDHATPNRFNLFRHILYSVFPRTSINPSAHQPYHHLFNSLILHFRPRNVPERTLRFTLTWGLGGMAVVLICLLFVTGLMLKFVYQPVPERAYESILHLQSNVLFGQLIRNIHHWSGNLLLLVTFGHFLRVFFTGAFHPPRQFNWVIGLGLFLAILAANITGYLLPWDQLAFWAITICTSMLEYIPFLGKGLQNIIRGGSDIGPATLSNFFAIHTAVIPAGLMILMPWHFWRIRKAGGLVIPRAPGEDKGQTGGKVPTVPNLIVREMVVALVLVAVIMMVAVFFNAPLESKANPGLSPNPTKAPWYFAGIQELLLHFHPLFALVCIPVVVVAALIGIPYGHYSNDTGGVWFASHKGRRMAVVAMMAALFVTPIGIVVDEIVIDFSSWMPDLPPIVAQGIFPVGVILAGLLVFSVVMQKTYAASNKELVQTIFILLVIVFMVLTITGVWFRGEGMALVWPWNIGG